MTDPNVTYKLAFAELSRELGRTPTSNELLGLHDAYKRAWGPAEESTAAGRPEPTGFSRKPAPQARTEGEIDAREKVPDLMAALEASLAPFKLAREGREQAGEPLSAPRIIPEGPGAASEPDASRVNPGAAEGLREGDRGPGDGLVAKCVKCGRLWERPARKGRPAIWCEECR